MGFSAKSDIAAGQSGATKPPQTFRCCLGRLKSRGYVR